MLSDLGFLYPKGGSEQYPCLKSYDHSSIVFYLVVAKWKLEWNWHDEIAVDQTLIISDVLWPNIQPVYDISVHMCCLLYTSDAADE